MALINCSECGKQISDRADKCLNCGNPINKDRFLDDLDIPSSAYRNSKKSGIIPSAYTKPSEVHGKNDGCFMQTLNFGCVTALIIAGIIVLFFLVVIGS
jgi:DNA-directed RNA polymerase subunit RPC12/RpoP